MKSNIRVRPLSIERRVLAMLPDRPIVPEPVLGGDLCQVLALHDRVVDGHTLPSTSTGGSTSGAERSRRVNPAPTGDAMSNPQADQWGLLVLIHSRVSPRADAAETA